MKVSNSYRSDTISRRKFIGTTAALGSIVLLPGGLTSCKGSSSDKPDSKFAGVQIGVQTYSFRSMPFSAEDILGYLLDCGLNTCELMADPMEQFAGIPQYRGPSYPRGKELTDQQKAELEAAQSEFAKELRSWRSSVSMNKFKELRKMYNSAGVDIHLSRLGSPTWSDEEIDYAFKVADTLGSHGPKWELSLEAVERLVPFCKKYKMQAHLHNHYQVAEPGFSYDTYLAYSDRLMINFDLGHYVGSLGKHPNEIIEKYHNRIVAIQIKDKTGPDSDPPNTNMPYGQGDTPLADILLLLKNKKWPIIVDIELEHKIPEGSNAVIEVKKCIEYCKNILLA